MKQNYRMKIAYDGTRYYGWERQRTTDLTIQGKIEGVLREMTGSEVDLIAAGRTDAGVHARAMTANVHMETELSLSEIKQYMNHYLPEDICILEVEIAGERFHSRFRAVGKTYRYTCYYGEEKPVFDRKYVYVLEQKPDLERMKRAAALLTGKHDYTSFCGNTKMKKSAVRTVDRIVIAAEGNYITLTYHGDGFLQYMIRILTGTLLEVGLGRREPETMTALLEARNRSLAGYTVPPKGLCLMEVEY